MKFTHYVALGDSMSIDLYPSLDLGHDEEDLPIGAASLFFKNHDETWPEMRGEDLSTRFPGIAAINLATDGARTDDVLKFQLPRLTGLVKPQTRAVVTLTAGGNDLLLAYDADDDLELAVREIASNLADCVEEVSSLLPDAVVLITTVYDPTDGTGTFPGVSEVVGDLPIEHLEDFNDLVRDLADGERVWVADARKHFRGHGRKAAPGECWYWEDNPIEPSARGAHELRKLWLEALTDAG